MTIGKLSKTHKSVPVNPLLARAMYLKGYIEKSGTGTEDMIAKCKEWGIPAPEWTEDDADDFRVILKRPMAAPSVEKTMVNTGVETSVETGVKTRVETRVESSVESSVKSRAKKLSSAEKILSYLVANPTATAHELSIVVNLTVKGVEWNLKALTESGRLRHLGPTKGGHWEVLA
jgi:ATP-dependent DNA helicase RecG